MVAPGLTVMVQGDEDGNMFKHTLWKLNQQIQEIEYRQIRHDRMRGEDWHDSKLRDLRRERETAELELQVYDLSHTREILSKRERELLKSLELKLKLRGGSEQSHAILGKKSLHGPRLEELNEMLVEAAEKGDLENVKCNIIEGADIETNARELVTPLWCAVANKHKSIVEFLLEKGANVEVANIFNETVLHRAITTGQDDIIDLLIKYHADVNSKGYKGQTPLLHACIQKNTKIALLLLENGAKLGASDDQGNSELSHATRNGSLSLTKLLVEKGAELEKVNATGMTPFLWAAFSGSVSVGLYLRKKGSVITAVDHDGFTALHWSSSCNQVPFMGVLLGEALEDLNFTAPEKAEIAELGPQLQSIAFDIDSISERGETPLHVAANRGNSEAVSMLLKHGANFNARDESRRTALHHSVQFGEPKNEITMGLFLLLPTITTIMSAKDADGETALQIAVRKGYNRLVEILLQEIRPQSRNIVLDDNSEAGSTLFSAAPKKNKKIVQLLVNHEMDVVVEEEDGCKWARIERLNTKQVDSICALLLENKECWEQQPDSKQKTISWAARNSRLDLVRERSPESKDLNIILYWAAVGGGSEIVELLLKEYEDKIKNQRFAISNEDGCEAVMVAARNGNENVVKQLLKAFKEFGDVSVQADILEPKTENWTAVQWAIHYHTLHYHTLDASKVVKHLLMNGAIPEPPETTVAGNGSFVPAVEMARGLKGNPQFDEEIIAMLETPLRVAPQPLPVVMPKIDAQWLVEVCKSFKSRIIDFYTSEGGFFALDRNSVVEDTIYSEGPDTGMSRARKAWGIKSDLRFRWIHLPANNWVWVEDLIRISYESGLTAEEYTRIHNFVEQNCHEHTGAPPSRFMYPALTFEGKDFHSGEGEDTVRFRTQTGKEKSEKPIGLEAMRELGDDSAKVTLLDTIQNYSRNEGENRDLEVFDNESLKGKLPGQRKDHEAANIDEKISGLNKTFSDPGAESENIYDENQIAHLKGCIMALCVPFLTVRSVKSHRKLRQAVQLAEVLHYQSIEINAHKQGAKFHDDIHRTRFEILENAILDGITILNKTIATRKDEPMPLTTELLDHLKTLKKALEPPSGSVTTSSRLKPELHSLREKLGAAPAGAFASNMLGWRGRFEDALDIVQNAKTSNTNEKGLSALGLSETEGLILGYLGSQDSKGIHVTRTIDQYYYPSLLDTSWRDIDQVVRRYQIKKSKENKLNNDNAGLKNTSSKSCKRNGGIYGAYDGDLNFQMVMVDQLWVWIIDDKTIITCFPQSIDHDEKDDHHDDLLGKILQHIEKDARPRISSVYHLATMITSFCVSFVEDCHNALGHGPKESFLQMFSSSIGAIADKEVRCFEKFRTGIRKMDASGDADDSNDASNEALGLESEINLLEEIKDIRDELSILQSICDVQKNLMQKLFSLIAKPNRFQEQEIARDPVFNYYQERSNIDSRLEKISKMQADSTITYDSLNHLLDLKQKNSNIFEARQARRQAQLTTKQGSTILVFTIVTIIFLPMSFLSSLFALNVDSFPHQGGTLSYQHEWIFSRIFGATAALAIPLILMAIYITKFLKFLNYIFGLIWDLFIARKDGSDISERTLRHLSPVSSQQQAVPTPNTKGVFGMV